ncbi:VOC family protein [Arhodomonas sp. AD133]|uniref:VOC family protein n=1 Tax=Arhodomonas sp. AD133 TaxID=3415009 RepID=UPI003EBD4F75
MDVSTYLFFDGDCREAFEFYERALGGRIETMMTYGEGSARDKVPAEAYERIMHVCLSLGGYRIMGSDRPVTDAHQPIQGAYLVLGVADPDEAKRLFDILSGSGHVEMPMEETFWARRFGTTVDRFGVRWMVNCEKAD